MSELKLYIALLGGKHEKANVEVHDVVPVISSDIKTAFPYLEGTMVWCAKRPACRWLDDDQWCQLSGSELSSSGDRHTCKTGFKIIPDQSGCLCARSVW